MSELVEGNEFVSSLLREGDLRYPTDHPFLELFHQGKLSKEQLGQWAINRYYFHRHIPDKDAAVASNCPSDVRGLWIGKLVEEAGEGGKPSHPDLWLRYCDDLGLARNAVINAEVLPSIKMAVDGYVNLGRHKPWRIGAGASLTEFTVPKKMDRMITAFKTHYPFVTEEGMTFFKEHKEADEEHGKLIIQILTNYCKSQVEQAEAREGYFFKLDLHRVILDAVHYELLRNNGG